MNEYFCILGGGGIRGTAYTGAIKALKELNINLTGLAGSSIGAIVAGLYTFGYSTDEIQEIFNSINFEFFKDINLTFGKDFALSKGKNFYEWIKTKIEDKFYENSDAKRKPVTFSDLEKELIIVSVDLATSKLYEFSKEKTPDVEIAHAIRVSVAMPGLYTPVFDENECLADGDLSKAMPLFKISETINKKPEKILELRLENNETKKKISNTIDYLNAVYDTVSGIASDYLISLYQNHDKYDILKINTENISVVDFMINKDKKAKMAQIGYNTIIDYFKNKYPKKKKMLLDIYKNILSSLENTEFLIKKKDIKEANCELQNVFPIIAKEKEILDKALVESILDLNNSFKKSSILKKGFLGSKLVLADDKRILDELNNVKTRLNAKIGEFA